MPSTYTLHKNLSGDNLHIPKLHASSHDFDGTDPITVFHNNTSGLQGGTTNEYYHLTSASYTEITTFFNNTDITGAEAETLSNGSNADLLHLHTNSSVTLAHTELSDMSDDSGVNTDHDERYYDYEIVNGTRYAQTDVGIEAACVAAATGSGKVYLPAGTYTISARIDISQDNIIIEGAGDSTILYLADNINTDVIYLTSSPTNIKLKNFKIDGNKDNNSSGGCGVSVNVNSSNIVLDNLHIVNTKSSSISFLGNSGPSFVSNCYIEDSGSHGIYTWNASHTIIVYNRIDTPTQSGIQINNNSEQSDVVISNNIINDVSATDKSGIAVAATTVNQSHNVSITGNSISGGLDSGSGSNGIYCEWAKATITGNTLNDITGVIIEVKGNGSVIGDNTAEHYSGTTSKSGISLINPSDCTVVNNYITGTKNYGIYLNNSDDCNNIIIANNVSKNNASGAIGIRAETDTTTSNISIFGNHLYDDQDTPTQDYGIYCFGSGTHINIQSFGNFYSGNQTADTSGLPTSIATSDSIWNASIHRVSGTQDYDIFEDSNTLWFQGQTSGTGGAFWIVPKDEDGTDDVGFGIVGVGGPTTGLTNLEALLIQYATAPTQKYQMWSNAGGTGTVRPIELLTGTNDNQVLLNTDGTVSFSSGAYTADDFYVNTVGLNDTASGAAGCSLIGVPGIGSATVTKQCQLNTDFGSVGRRTGGTITDAGSETVNVAAGTGYIKAEDVDTSELLAFDWSASNGISIPTNSTRFIGVKYGDPPAVDSRETQNWDLDSEFPLGSVINLNGVLYILNNPWWVTDGITNLIEKSVGLGGYLARDNFVGGLILGVTGTRNPTMTQGTVWGRTNEFEMTEINYSTPTGSFFLYWFESDGTVHEETNGGAGYTQYPVTQWNDIDNDQLDNLLPNRYANWWVMLNITNNELSFIYPSAYFSSAAAAEAEAVPSHIPGDWYLEGILIGKITFKTSTDAPVEVLSVFNTIFSASLAADHGNLAGLSDDDHTQYLLADGTRALTDNWDVGNYTVTANNFTADGTITDGTASLTGGALSGITTLDVNNYMSVGNYATPDARFICYIDNLNATDAVRYGNYLQSRVSTASNAITNTQRGFYGKVYWQIGGNNLTEAIGVAGMVHTNIDSDTLANAYAFHSLVQNAKAGNTITNAYNYYGATPIATGTITNAYGLYLADINTGSTNYAIYTGAGDVRFGDDVDVTGNITVSGTVDGVDIASWIDQDVSSGSAPTFTADNFSDGGTNAIVTTTQETNWDNHIADNSQAHTDYLINNGDDTTSGTLTAAQLRAYSDGSNYYRLASDSMNIYQAGIGYIRHRTSDQNLYLGVNDGGTLEYPIRIIGSTANVELCTDGSGYVVAGANIVSDTDSTDDLGDSTHYWANAYIDQLYVNNQIGVSGDADLIQLAADALTVNGTLTSTGDIAADGGIDGFLSLPVQQAKTGHITSANQANLEGGEKRWSLVFDPDTDQEAEWQFVMPPTYNSNATLYLQVLSTNSVASNNCIMNASIFACADGEVVETDSFDTTNAFTIACDATAGEMVTDTATLSNKDSVSAGELVVLKLKRDADNGSDNNTGNLEVVGLMLYWEF